MASRQITDLYRLARLFGVQTAYYDVTHKRRQAVPESLLSGLQALGAPVQTVGDVPAALRERQRSLWQLSASRARVVLCNLEDLWQESVPQNTPATSGECLNWRLKARYTFEAFRQMPTVLDALREMDRRRKQRRGDARTRPPSRPGVRAR